MAENSHFFSSLPSPGMGSQNKTPHTPLSLPCPGHSALDKNLSTLGVDMLPSFSLIGPDPGTPRSTSAPDPKRSFSVLIKYPNWSPRSKSPL